MTTNTDSVAARERLIDAIERLAFSTVGLTAAALQASGATHDLTFLQWRCLVVIGGEGPVRLGSLAGRIGATASSTSRLVGRLERQGWIARDPEPDDRRAVRLHLTAAGAAVRAAVVADRRSRIANSLDDTSAVPDPIAPDNSVIAALDRVADRLAAWA